MNDHAMVNLVVDVEINQTSYILTQLALITHGYVTDILIVTMNRMKQIAFVLKMSFNAMNANVVLNVKKVFSWHLD